MHVKTEHISHTCRGMFTHWKENCREAVKCCFHDAAGVKNIEQDMSMFNSTKQTGPLRWACRVGTVVHHPKAFFSPFYTCSDCSSLIWPPLPFFILSFLPFTHPSSPSPHLLSHRLPPLSFDSRRTGYVCSPRNETMKPLSPSSLPFLSHYIHHLLIHRLSACLLACQFLCSSYFCVTACSL